MVYTNEALQNVKYDRLDTILEEVHKECIKIDGYKEKKCLVERFERVINTFLNEMKTTDPSFKKYFNRVGYTGSFYEGVRIGAANEFDLNLILKLKLKMKTEKSSCQPGFVAIRVLNKESCEKPVKDWILNDLLQPQKVKQWIEGIIDKTIHSLWGIIDDCTIRMKKSGPAITLIVKTSTAPAKEISIDLVPVIEFPCSEWPQIPRKSKKILNGGYEKSWFAVPKNTDTWRMSFPLQEKEMITKLNYLKHTLRLLKQVRDELKMFKIASYYIKTLFLWEIENNRDHDFWVKNRRGRLFMHMLMKFKEALEMKSLKFYWDENCNLLGDINDDCLVNDFGKLRNFIMKIDRLVDAQNQHELENYMRKMLMQQTNIKKVQPKTAKSKRGWFSCSIL